MKTQDIHVINRYFIPVKAGIEVALEHVLRNLSEEGLKTVVHVSANTLERQNILPLRDHLGKIEIRRYPSFNGYFIPRIPYRTANVVVFANFTLLPHLWCLTEIALRKLTRRKRFSVVFFPCGGFTPGWDSMPRVQQIVKGFLQKTVGKVLLNYVVDRTGALSEWEKRELISAGLQTPIDVVPLGVEKEEEGVRDEAVSADAKRIAETAQPYVIQIARIHPIKNIDTVIRALAAVPEPLSYVIIGGTENAAYMEELRELIFKHNLEKRVIFTGNRGTADKYFLVDHSVAMVHMSHNESFGIALYEGLSRGKLVIAADNTAQREAVVNGKNGFLIGTRDWEKLAKAFSYIITPEGQSVSAAMSVANRKRGGRYTWRNTTELFKRLL